MIGSAFGKAVDFAALFARLAGLWTAHMLDLEQAQTQAGGIGAEQVRVYSLCNQYACRGSGAPPHSGGEDTTAARGF